MGPNPILTLLHRCTLLAFHHRKWINTQITSCIPQAKVLRYTAGFYMAKVQIYCRKETGLCVHLGLNKFVQHLLPKNTNWWKQLKSFIIIISFPTLIFEDNFFKNQFFQKWQIFRAFNDLKKEKKLQLHMCAIGIPPQYYQY